MQNAVRMVHQTVLGMQSHTNIKYSIANASIVARLTGRNNWSPRRQWWPSARWSRYPRPLPGLVDMTLIKAKMVWGAAASQCMQVWPPHRPARQIDAAIPRSAARNVHSSALMSLVSTKVRDLATAPRQMAPCDYCADHRPRLPVLSIRACYAFIICCPPSLRSRRRNADWNA